MPESRSAWQGFDARWMSRFLCPPVPTRMSLPQSGHGSVLSAVNSPVVLKDALHQPLHLHTDTHFFFFGIFNSCVGWYKIFIRY
ncbi:hypothetical protein L208DRAFT_1404364 [Tricholoma matsutake]|nr:hypothetical protein L208DRAFT_1404364 [Tricholoma matsutake 945]